MEYQLADISLGGEFKNYIMHNKPLLAAIQETRFLDSDSMNYNFNIRDYSLYTDNVSETPRGAARRFISQIISCTAKFNSIQRLTL